MYYIQVLAASADIHYSLPACLDKLRTYHTLLTWPFCRNPTCIKQPVSSYGTLQAINFPWMISRSDLLVWLWCVPVVLLKCNYLQMLKFMLKWNYLQNGTGFSCYSRSVEWLIIYYFQIRGGKSRLFHFVTFLFLCLKDYWSITYFTMYVYLQKQMNSQIIWSNSTESALEVSNLFLNFYLQNSCIQRKTTEETRTLNWCPVTVLSCLLWISN